MTSPGDADRELERLRDEIDSIDERIVGLLSDRSRLAIALGRVKRRHGLPIHSPEREREVLELVAHKNPGPLPDLAMRRLFERIIDESRSLERQTVEGEET